MSDDRQDAEVPVLVGDDAPVVEGPPVPVVTPINSAALVPMVAGRVVPLAEARLLAEDVFQSNLFPKKIERASQALVILLTGWELGLGFMASLRAIHVIDGQVSLAADLQKALVKRNGQSRFTYDRGEGYCELLAERLDTGETITVRWDRERVERSKVSFSRKHGVKDNWKHHEEAMLRHRCDSEATGILWPDVVLNVYAPEELAFGSPATVELAPSETVNAKVRAALELPAAAQSGDLSASADDAPGSAAEAANVAEADADTAQRVQEEQRAEDAFTGDDPNGAQDAAEGAGGDPDAPDPVTDDEIPLDGDGKLF